MYVRTCTHRHTAYHEIKNSRFFGVPSTNFNYFANYSLSPLPIQLLFPDSIHVAYAYVFASLPSTSTSASCLLNAFFFFFRVLDFSQHESAEDYSLFWSKETIKMVNSCHSFCRRGLERKFVLKSDIVLRRQFQALMEL